MEMKPFDKVLVRNLDQYWQIDHFGYENAENYYVCSGGRRWLMCIPYEGNEHLLGTLYAPDEKKEPKQRWRAEKGKPFYMICTNNIVTQLRDDWLPYDNLIYEGGNYFQTREEAEEYADKIRNLLINR